jgi:phosphatidylserine/phosphatidylglycerophosphate/cardiolipin synthase-like enzyme
MNKLGNSREIVDLMQSIFVSELLSPSRCLWIVSPWISDIPLIDNRSNQFLTLEPNWARRKVVFSEVLAHLLQRGTTIHIAAKPDQKNRTFLEAMRARGAGLNKLEIHLSAALHSKGILGDDFYLSGSMNITFNGIELADESVQFHMDPEVVSSNRIDFLNWWGGEKQ